MSKITAFIIALLIYISSLALSYYLYIFFFKKEYVKLGNSSIDIVLIDNILENNIGNNMIKQEIVNIPVKNEKKQVDNINSDSYEINDLFGDLNYKPSNFKNIKNENKGNQQPINFDQINKLLDFNTSSSNKKVQPQEQINGIYDEYFGRVNAFLTNQWTLLTSKVQNIDVNESVEIEFTIDKFGVLTLKRKQISSNTVLKEKAIEFIDKINSKKHNLGIPPGGNNFNGVLRLSVKLIIKEIQ